jgi:hypothetical protein
MKRAIIVLLLAIYQFIAFSQEYSGILINAENGEPVAFANIGITDRNIGTVSNAGGWFEIELNSTYDKDSLRISCIGYLDKQFMIHDLKNEIRNAGMITIKLIPISYDLDEVLIKPNETRNYTLGYYCDSNSAYGNAFYSTELGTEMGVVMQLPRKKDHAYLRRARFYVGEFTFDTFPVRLNIYNLKDGLPDKNILKETVFIDITSPGEYVIELTPQNITVNGDFFISLEYYRIPDNTEGKLVFCAVHSQKNDKGKSYYRWASQGNWQAEMFDTVGFSIEAECKK